MTGGREAARRPARAPLRRRSRQRWAVAGGVAACWLVLEVVTGSVVSATVVLMVIAALVAAGVGGLRTLGITTDHPWIRRMASRPWRDGQDVLNVAMRHLADVFVVTPSGALLAPNLVELQLNPDDLDFLCERMDLGVISASMTEVYQEQVSTYGARLAGAGRAEVYVIAAGSVPPGRYRLRQGDPVSIDAQPDHYANAAPEWAYSAPQHAYAESGGRWEKPDPDLTVGGGMVTIMEPSPAAVPVLRLVTGSSVAETRISGARAGRGSVELVLPDVLTVSQGARHVHVLRRSLVDHEPGQERAHSQRCPGRRGATPQRRRYDPLGSEPRRAAVPRQDRLMPSECDYCHSRHGTTGRPRRGQAVVRGVATQWRRAGFSCGQRRSVSG